MGIELEQLESEKAGEMILVWIASYEIVFELAIGLVWMFVIVFEFELVLDFDFAPVLETVQ